MPAGEALEAALAQVEASAEPIQSHHPRASVTPPRVAG